MIRFLHADFLRLGAPLSGVAETPGWLQQLMTDSVRSAVRNLIQTAVANDADFVLITGGLAADPADADTVALWLREHLEPLRSRGIRLVATQEAVAGQPVLQSVCDLVLRPGECLKSFPGAGDRIELRSVAENIPAESPLLISIGKTSVQRHRATLWYQAIPSQRCPSRTEHVSAEGTLAVSAGPVQALNSSETGAHGCFFVEADVASRQVRARFVPTDTLRFCTEQLVVRQLVAPETLVAELAQASAALRESDGRTRIVSWNVDAQVAGQLSEAGVLEEWSLLKRLRDSLQAGHRGVWPQSIRFTPTSVLRIADNQRQAVEELMTVATGSAVSDAMHVAGRTQNAVRGGSGLGASYLAAMTLLGRVA
ncbi:MAG: hypothetical protein KDA89_10220 [Planctomycetaceae bacterium]|nr:hypothetical protein [Planctomycetaceae bacterium]